MSILSLIFYYLFFFLYIDDRLYIVMELIEGAPLGEHFSSLKETRHHFAEERLWKIFIQVSFIVINFSYEAVKVSADSPEVCVVVVSGCLSVYIKEITFVCCLLFAAVPGSSVLAQGEEDHP